MKKNYLKNVMRINFLILFLLTGKVFYAQTAADSAMVKQAADTLNLKIESIKDDLGLMKKFKVTGYLQAQWQMADSAGIASFAGGNFPKYADNRFAVRRGRLKFQYEGEYSSFVIQIDATQNGVTLKDAYLTLKDPWLQMFTLTGGVFNRPFGFEIGYSSSLRESPERARITQTLFPGERDLGGMISIQPRKESRFNFIRLDLGLICGNAIAPEIDSHKDFVGHLYINRTTKNQAFKYGLGVSYYNGGYFQESKFVYNMNKVYPGGPYGFVVDSLETNKGAYAKREYYGADAQFSLDWAAGMTTIRGEYIWGTQPGSYKSNVSPNNRTYVDPGIDTYVRPMSGGYVYFIQNIGQSRHSIVIKYDWLDPNTDVAGKDITATVDNEGTAVKTYLGPSDIKYTTWGFGYNLRVTSNVKLMAYYDLVKNEDTNIKGYTQDLKDNVFTLRLQFKF
jgi:hypothetical protein